MMKRTLLFFWLLSFTHLLNAQQQTIGFFQNDSLAQNGYTLWSVGNYTYLVDNCGYEINSWRSDFPIGLSSYLLENGNLLRTGRVSGAFPGPGQGGLIEEFDWEGNLIWHYVASTPFFQQHHDIEPLPNGNILLVAWEGKTVNEAIAAGAESAVEYWPVTIIEIEKLDSVGANIVWQWHAWDHLIQDFDSTKANYGVIADHPELININYEPPGNRDWLHVNAVDYDPVRDEILLSARSMNEIYIIDHSTTTAEAAGHSGGNKGKGGDLLYRWGNPEAYGRGTLNDLQLNRQHDVQVVPEGYPDAGALTVFNNAGGWPVATFSTVDLFYPERDVNGNYQFLPDGKYAPEFKRWQYKGGPNNDLFSANMAGAHQLPNGNILICEANKGRFIEVTPDGTIVWHYQNTINLSGPMTQGSNPSASSVFRATKYASDFIGFEGKDLRPGDPVEINPVNYECIIYEDPTTNLTKRSLPDDVHMFPNPVEDHLHIVNENTESLFVQLLDVNGKIHEVFTIGQGRSNLNLATYPKGIYFLFFSNANGSQYQIKKVVKH